MFLVVKRLSELELNVSHACSSFIPFLKRKKDIALGRKFSIDQNLSDQIQTVVHTYELFRQNLPQTVRSSFFSFSLLKQRVIKLLELGHTYRKLLKKMKIILLLDEEKGQQFNISDFFAVYVKCARSLNLFLNEGISKFYLAIVFFLLSLFLFFFSYLCMTSYFSYLFVVLSFCFGAYLIFAGLWDFLESIIQFQDKILETLKSQWILIPEESSDDS